MRAARASVAIATFFIAVGSCFSSAAQTFVSLGYGGVTCTDWNSRKMLEGKAYEAWMLGYISSYNAYVFRGSNVVEGSNIDELRSWVDTYCKDHASENFDTVVRSLIDEHAKKNAN